MQQAKGVLEHRAKERPTVETVRPPHLGTGVNPRAAPRGSGRQRQFRKVYRQADT